MIIKANAKVNLSLDITGRREDGYHNISSVMQSISLCDEIELVKSKSCCITLSSNRSDLPDDRRNTAYRAAEKILAYAGITDMGVKIFINKHIPSEAGLGGGSADAAAVLLGLKEMFSVHISETELMKMAASIGADVPFCIKGGTALCEGIGEIVNQLMPIPSCYIVVCKPPVGVSTKEAYDAIDRYMNDNILFTPALEDAVWKNDIGLIASLLGNRFDDILHIPDVQIIKSIFNECGSLGSAMSGSGSSAFGIFDNIQKAEKAAEAVKNCGETFICNPI